MASNLSGARMAGVQEMLNKPVIKPEQQESSVLTKNSVTLKDLIFLGRSTKSVNVGGFDFDFATYTNDEQRFLLELISKTPLEERAYHVRIYALALSIKKINGVPMHTLYEGSDKDSLSEFEKNISILRQMQTSVVDLLTEHYDKIVSESTKSLREKEAIEDIKK